jgi:hypothetical protein
METSLLSSLLEKGLITVIIAIITRGLVYFKSPIIAYFKNKLKRVEENFFLSVAQRNRYEDKFKLVMVAVIVGFGFVSFSFFEKQREFQVFEQKFDTARVVHDSLYHRAISGKLKFADNYEAEIDDIRSGIGFKKVSIYESKPNIVIAMIEHNMLMPMKVSMTAFMVIMTSFECGLWVIAALLAFLLLRILLRHKHITDFDWKLSRLQGIESRTSIASLRRQWANMKSQEDYSTIMKDIDLRIKNLISFEAK